MPNQEFIPTPPIAPRQPKALELHGDVRIDDYFWLRERDNPAVIAYLQAENDYTTAVMHHTEPLQEQLYQEMRARIKETDSTVPERIGDYLYYRRTEAGKQYAIYCRRYQSMATPEEVLLDVNALAADREFAAIGNYQISPDQRLLAYAR
jgi:oligopeptidase B